MIKHGNKLKFALYLDKDMVDWLKIEAKSNNRSINSLIRSSLFLSRKINRWIDSEIGLKQLRSALNKADELDTKDINRIDKLEGRDITELTKFCGIIKKEEKPMTDEQWYYRFIREDIDVEIREHLDKVFKDRHKKQTLKERNDELEDLAKQIKFKKNEETVKVDEHKSDISLLDDEIGVIYFDCKFANWDGFNAVPINEATYNNAIEFCKHIPRDIREPGVSACPDGSISFDWYKAKNMTFVASVCGDKRVVYAGIMENLKPHGAFYLDDKDQNSSSILFWKLLRNFFSKEVKQ